MRFLAGADARYTEARAQAALDGGDVDDLLHLAELRLVACVTGLGSIGIGIFNGLEFNEIRRHGFAYIVLGKVGHNGSAAGIQADIYLRTTVFIGA